MSDEIKTGHSALGLLMAECEQLRRDLAQAKAENARMAAENFKLKGELGSVRKGSGKVVKFLRAELREQRDKLSEIDRLAEECKNLSVKGATICYQCGTTNPAQTLADLLAPTIELLDSLHGYMPEDDRAIRNELARLRAITKQ